MHRVHPLTILTAGIGAGAALCLAGFVAAWRWVENRTEWNLGEPADTGAEAMLATLIEED